MIRRVLLVLMAGTLSGCFEATQQTIARYNTPLKFDGPQAPALNVASAPTSPSSAMTLSALPERAAAAYIEAVAKRSDTAKALRGDLAEAIKKDGASGVDQTLLSRVVTISVQRDWLRPGDRYALTAVDIVPAPDAGFTFTGFESAATEYSTINIGTATVSNETAAGAEIDPTFGSDLVGTGKFSVSSKQTNGATRNINERQQLSVTVGPGRVSVIRTGGEGQDLTGVTLVKLSLRQPRAGTTPYLLVTTSVIEDGKAKKPADAKITWARSLIGSPKTLWACGRLRYQDRVIEKGAEFQDEGRQKVLYQSSMLPWAPFALVPSGDLRVPLWAILGTNGVLSVNTGVSDERMSFSDYDMAEELVAWLRLTKSATIGASTINEGGAGHPVSSFATLAVTPVDFGPVNDEQPDCTKIKPPTTAIELGSAYAPKTDPLGETDR